MSNIDHEELFQFAPDAYLVTDLAGTIVEANRAAVSLLGVEVPALCGLPLARFVPEREQASFEALLGRLEAVGDVEAWTLTIVPSQGDERSVAATALARRTEPDAGRLVRWLLRDVTDRRRADRALVRLMRQRQAILDSAAEAIFGVDSEGAISFVNVAGTRMLERPEHALVGRPLADVLIEAAPGRPAGHAHWMPLRETLRRGRSGRGELEIRRADGSTVALEYRSTGLVEDDRQVGAVVSLVDITERKRLEHELKYQADHDPLTEMLNRRAFERELARELAFTARYDTPTAAMLLDVDGLKRVNDVFGHAVGDDVLRTLAGVLRGRLRRTDSAGRLGGDEFGILLPRADAVASRTVATEILSVLRKQPLPTCDHDLRVSVSIGVALVRGGKVAVDDVFRAADRAMYQAKQAGGDRTVVVESVQPSERAET